MDRFEWLKCQSWLLPCPGAAVDWCFEGSASFCISSRRLQSQTEEDETLSRNAAHLFFSAQGSSLDPAQFALRLGVAHQGTRLYRSDIVLCFDNGSCYYLDFAQVMSVITWEQEHGCEICKEANNLSASVTRRENACACQLLPVYVTVKLKQVSMIVYPRDESSDGSSPKIVGAIDLLYKAFEEEVSKCDGERKIGSACFNAEKIVNLSSVHSSSKRIMQQYLTQMDSINECAFAAANACYADIPWMIRLLHVMVQHIAAHKERSLQSKPLQSQLQPFLFSLEDEEQRYMSRIWAANSTAATRQEGKADAVANLQHTLEKREQVEEAILWLELSNAYDNME